MKEKQTNLSAKQEKAIISLLSETTIKQAAEKCGVGETTIYRWMNEKAFDRAFKDARKNALNQTISHLQQSTANAVETLKDIMLDREATSSSRVTAAKTVLEMAFKAYELQDLAEEVAEMKQHLEELKENN